MGAEIKNEKQALDFACVIFQILKILRIENNYRSAEKKIKSMLSDEKFNRISGELELELVQLYKAQGDFEDIESRLETIVNDYQRTTVSAEAYYQLGKIHTSDKWIYLRPKNILIWYQKNQADQYFHRWQVITVKQ